MVTVVPALFGFFSRLFQFLAHRPLSIGANPCTTLLGSTEIARPKRPKIEAQRVERGEILGEGMFPFPPAKQSGGAL